MLHSPPGRDLCSLALLGAGENLASASKPHIESFVVGEIRAVHVNGDEVVHRHTGFRYDVGYAVHEDPRLLRRR